MLHRSRSDIHRELKCTAPVLLGMSKSGAGARAEINREWNLRRAKRKYFPPELFADAAWDMLLHLYVAEVAGHRSSVTETIRAADVPHATAHRWLNHLMNLGLCHKRQDTADRRRFFVRLSGKGIEAMDGYFSQVLAATLA